MMAKRKSPDHPEGSPAVNVTMMASGAKVIWFFEIEKYILNGKYTCS